MSNLNKKQLLAYLKNHTTEQASNYFSVSKSTIFRELKKYNLRHCDIKYGSSLNQKQKDIISGSLLGKGKIRNKRFEIRTNLKNKEYLEWMKTVLQPFAINMFENRQQIILSTCNHYLFKDYKIEINIDSIVHWFVQNNYHVNKRFFKIKSNKKYTKDITNVLQNKLSVKCKIFNENNYDIIFINSKEYDNFVFKMNEIIKWSCFKINHIKKKNNLGSNKLNYKIAQEIRKQKHLSVKELSCKYEVSLSTIYNILNNVTYKQPSTAIVKLIYNPH